MRIRHAVRSGPTLISTQCSRRSSACGTRQKAAQGKRARRARRSLRGRALSDRSADPDRSTSIPSGSNSPPRSQKRCPFLRARWPSRASNLFQIGTRVADQLLRHVLRDLTVPRYRQRGLRTWVFVQRVLCSFANEHGSACDDASDDLYAFHAAPTRSIRTRCTACCGRPRSACNARMSFTAEITFLRAAAGVRPCPYAPGRAGTSADHHRSLAS